MLAADAAPWCQTTGVSSRNRPARSGPPALRRLLGRPTPMTTPRQKAPPGPQGGRLSFEERDDLFPAQLLSAHHTSIKRRQCR
jgi:hypothetical protein